MTYFQRSKQLGENSFRGSRSVKHKCKNARISFAHQYCRQPGNPCLCAGLWIWQQVGIFTLQEVDNVHGILVNNLDALSITRSLFLMVCEAIAAPVSAEPLSRGGIGGRRAHLIHWRGSPLKPLQWNHKWLQQWKNECHKTTILLALFIILTMAGSRTSIVVTLPAVDQTKEFIWRTSFWIEIIFDFAVLP